MTRESRQKGSIPVKYITAPAQIHTTQNSTDRSIAAFAKLFWFSEVRGFLRRDQAINGIKLNSGISPKNNNLNHVFGLSVGEVGTNGCGFCTRF